MSGRGAIALLALQDFDRRMGEIAQGTPLAATGSRGSRSSPRSRPQSREVPGTNTELASVNPDGTKMTRGSCASAMAFWSCWVESLKETVTALNESGAGGVGA